MGLNPDGHTYCLVSWSALCVTLARLCSHLFKQTLIKVLLLEVFYSCD